VFEDILPFSFCVPGCVPSFNDVAQPPPAVAGSAKASRSQPRAQQLSTAAFKARQNRNTEIFQRILITSIPLIILF
jgi:hypothetical protein